MNKPADQAEQESTLTVIKEDHPWAGLLFINFIFFMLFAIGGASMANVEGVAGSWAMELSVIWLIFNIPWLIYAVSYSRNYHNKVVLAKVRKCVRYTGWLAFPGGISVFILIGSSKVLFSLIFPVVQTISAIVLFRRHS